MKSLVTLLGCLLVLSGIVGALALEIWGIAYVIFGIIEMANGNVATTFGGVLGLVAVWFLRSLACFAVMLTGVGGGAALIHAGGK